MTSLSTVDVADVFARFFDAGAGRFVAVPVGVIVVAIAGWATVTTVLKAVTLQLGPVGLARRVVGTVLAITIAVWVATDPAGALTAILARGFAALSWTVSTVGQFVPDVVRAAGDVPDPPAPRDLLGP